MLYYLCGLILDLKCPLRNFSPAAQLILIFLALQLSPKLTLIRCFTPCVSSMLGLLRNPSVRDSSPRGSDKQQQPMQASPQGTDEQHQFMQTDTRELIPTPEAEKDNPLDAFPATPSHTGANHRIIRAFSPPASPVANSIRVNKRASQYGSRRLHSGIVRASYGHKAATIEVVKEQYAFISQRCHRELGASVGAHAFDTSYAGLLEWIRAERLTRLPPKGGCWDRVLIAAQYFAEQVHRLNLAINGFTLDCGSASNLVFGQCLLLLELGHENAPALETAFKVFYQLGLELSPLLLIDEILNASPAIMENVARAFSELLSIVTGVAITFHTAVHKSGCRQSTRLDIYATFGASIDNFRSRVARTSHEMWTFILLTRGIDDDGYRVNVVQKWLAPQDTTLAFLASNHISLASRPEEFTCTWFQPYLNGFFKGHDDVLLVEGGSGTGKTVLANWVIDRLQRPLGRKNISALSFFYNSSIMAQATCIGMLKTLLCQLLARRIGDLDLLNVITKAHADLSTVMTAEKQEERLWKALESALSVVSEGTGETLAVIVDGLDEMDSQKPAAQKVAKKLHDLARKTAGIRLIQFNQPLGMPNNFASVENIVLSRENISDDIQTIFRQGLLTDAHFSAREYADQENLVDQLVVASEGSMLRATLGVQYLRLQKTCTDFHKSAEILKTSRSVADIVQHILSTKHLQLEADSKALLSWLVAAERPLSIHEVSLLLQAQPEASRMVERTINIHPIIKSVAAFTVTGEGLIALRHSAIKQALISIPGTSKLSLNLKERHRDLLIRLLICAKKHLRDEHEPCLSFLDQSKVDARIAAHHLLEYAIRYWATHFKKSPSLYKARGDLELPREFSAVFPSSVTFVLLEAGCLRGQHEAIELLTVAFRVRKALFGLDHAAVLQSAIVCAKYHETVLCQHRESIEWWAQAVHIGKIVLGFQSDLVITCCNTLLRISDAFVSEKTRTEIMTHREETLLVLVSSYKHRYGESSKEVLEIYQRLAELYVSICEEEKATEIYVKIKEITLVIHGGSSDEFDSVSRHLDVVLKKHDHKPEIEVLDGFLFGYREETEESWTIVRVDIMIRHALDLIERREFGRAEEIYIEIWLKLIEHCRSVLVCEWHEKKIEVMIKYASFLRVQKRFEESSAVLLCCWNEYSSHQVSMFESILVLLKEVAVCMKQVGMVSIALTVFQKCWSWFKSSHKEETTMFKEIEEHITVTSKEIVKTSTTTTVASSSETVIREVFESSFSETEITSTTVELCESLTSIYTEQQRWSEAISVIKSTLKKSWAAFFSESVESTTMASSFSSESIELVIKLAECYISQKRYEKAEYLYLRLYHVHRKCLSIDDASVIKYSELYLAFLKKHQMFGQVISFYQELLVEYRAFYGPTHSMTITILYALGDICRCHHLTHGYWIEYYLEIVVNLNKGAIICHEDAFRALVIVAEHYYKTLRYSESIVFFKSIIATFCKFGTKFKYFEDIAVVQKILEKYYRAIEETKMEIHTHVEILKEIHQACFKYFGESSSISISVTAMLAEVCCRSEKYEYEAVSYYEHVLKHSKSVSTTVAKRSQTKLKSLYVKQINSSSSSTTVTKEMVERATNMTYERYVEIRKTHSCTHEATLTHLKELITLYHKQSKIELAVMELRSLIVECITKVTSSNELIATARFIAEIYTTCGYISYAYELIREIKMQVIYKEASKTCGFNLVKIGPVCFAFIAAFEFYLHGNYTLTIAGFMAGLMAEYFFYERFTVSIKSKSKVHLVFTHAARLRQMLVRTTRTEYFAIIERQALEYFTSCEMAVVKVSTKASINLFVGTLLIYLSEHGGATNFVAAAGHAAVRKLADLLEKHKSKEALELATCTFHFLLSHEGLDDPTEITLGFQLCLLLAGRGKPKHTPTEPMLELSRRILAEVFSICAANNIDLARCPLAELNELIGLVGDQKDHARLQWLLSRLWSSREGLTAASSCWSPEVMLALGRRLVQAHFAAGNRMAAIRLAEDLLYNVRRVHGARDQQTLGIYTLLGSLYTSMAAYHLKQQKQEGDGKRGAELAQMYFRKAIRVHEDVLKLLVDAENEGSDDDDEDLDSELGSSRSGVTRVPGYLGTRRDEIERVRRHLRLLKLAVQRFGGWGKAVGEYEMLTRRIQDLYGGELKMSEEQILAKKWKLDGFGQGKAEGGLDEDGFVAPSVWAIC
ncbi:uncharacterized protein BCR38DRAFT_529142 [Pseudomassariella vexata]|uniref:Nephrocystin 3-like N-terminal domain-containing protein n=1 Tax=Pseudomassariella vexata TaxID=1141098 RepID=A0A1Y2D608_9PEZI|nr:uncharacterized protein BCR38DRAFT_529142 [Pseudomassariella vexata]ORY54739.1 hypothetical protein BCR38DRAFT_529142 [Pseudomassariella vexata]